MDTSKPAPAAIRRDEEAGGVGGVVVAWMARRHARCASPIGPELKPLSRCSLKGPGQPGRWRRAVEAGGSWPVHLRSGATSQRTCCCERARTRSCRSTSTSSRQYASNCLSKHDAIGTIWFGTGAYPARGSQGRSSQPCTPTSHREASESMRELREAMSFASRPSSWAPRTHRSNLQ